MAHLTMQHAFDQVLGVSVDTHVHRIADRLGWTKDAKTPGKTADQLEQWLPKEKWVTVNHMLVGFGQTICKPIGQRCWGCEIRSLCPSKDKNLVAPADRQRRQRLPDEPDTESGDTSEISYVSSDINSVANSSEESEE